MGQVSRPLRRLLGLLQPLVHLAPAVRVHLGQRDVPEDRRQEVVEIVGDPSGQDADRIQLVAPRHLLFQFFPLRDVPNDGREGDRLPGLIVPDGETVDLDRNRHTRPEIANPRLALPRPFLGKGRKHLLQGYKVLFQSEVLDPPSLVFSQVVQADELQAGLVQVEDLPVQRGDPDEIGAVLDEGHEDLLLLLHPLPMSDIPKVPHPPDALFVDPQRDGVALEHPAVLEFQDVEALRLFFVVQLPDLLHERLGLFQVSDGIRKREIVVPRCGDLLRNFPQLQELPVVARDPALVVHNEDAVRRRIQGASQERVGPPQLLLRLHPLRYVPADADDEALASPADEPRADLRGDAPAVLRLVHRLEDDGPIAQERRHPARVVRGMLRRDQIPMCRRSISSRA